MPRVSIHALTSRFKFNSFPYVYHLVANRFAVYWVTEMKKMIVAPEGSEDLAEEAGDCSQSVSEFQKNFHHFEHAR